MSQWAALKQLVAKNTRGTESTTKTNSILNCIYNLSLVVAIGISSKSLGYTYILSRFLQSKHLDLVTAVEQIKTITLTFQNMRENCPKVLSDI